MYLCSPSGSPLIPEPLRLQPFLVKGSRRLPFSHSTIKRGNAFWSAHLLPLWRWLEWRYVRYQSYFASARHAIMPHVICVAEYVSDERVPLAKLFLRLIRQSFVDWSRGFLTARFAAIEDELVDQRRLLFKFIFGAFCHFCHARSTRTLGGCGEPLTRSRRGSISLERAKYAFQFVKYSIG